MVKLLLRSTLFSLLIAWALTLNGQSHPVVFDHVSEGLPQKSISAFAQDQYGFIWIGTNYGLNRYDGARIQTFESIFHDSTSLRSNMITSLLVDKQGRLWIGTIGGGVNMYDMKQDRFIRLSSDNPRVRLKDDYVTTLYQDQNDVIWVGTENSGLFVYEPQSQSYHRTLYQQDDPGDVSSTSVLAISEDSRGHLWLGTLNEGLRRIEKGTANVMVCKKGDGTRPLASNTIRTLHLGGSGRLWIGTNGGLEEMVYDGQAEPSFRVPFQEGCSLGAKLRESVILSIVEQGDYLWVGTENNGLFRMTLATGEMEVYTHDPLDGTSISGNSIWSLFNDANGNLWIGTFLKGVSKINHLKQKFASTQKVLIDGSYESLGLTSSFAQEKNGDLWIGSDGNGLFYYDAKGRKYQHFHQDHPLQPLSSNAVVTTLIDQEDNLWVGTWGGGINLLKQGDNRFRHLLHDSQDPASLSGNDILHMIQDRKGRIWIAAFNRGLDVYLPSQDRFIHFSTESENRIISSNKVRTLAEDPEGNIWIGTQGDGLERITLNEKLEVVDRQCFYCKTEEDEFAAMTIQHLFFDREGKLWISSSGSGLFHLDQSTGNFTRYSKTNGLPSNLINALLEDERGIFWGSTNMGLFSFDLTKGQFTSYTKEDGLLADDYCKSSAFQAQDGKIYFGGNNGFDEFYAEEVSQNEQVPPIFITQVSVGGEMIKSEKGEAWILNDQSIELTHRQNDLNFEFIALNYVQSAKNQYQFKLEGYDDDWREVGGEPMASYINIPSGSYTFQVRAANNDGKWNEQGATLSVYIHKPWYATYLAIVIYIALLVASLWWARNSIISKERLRNKLKGEQLELAKMQEVNSMKTQFFTNISHEFKTPLTLIMSTLQVLAAKTKNRDELLFSLMKKHTERLSNLINQVLDLSQAEAGQAQLQARKQNIVDFLKRMSLSFRIYADEHMVSYKVEIPHEEIWIYFDAEKLEKVVTNLLSNAFKFTPEFGLVQLSLINQDQEIGIEVLDTGKGIHPTDQPFIFDRFYHSSPEGSHEGTGIGLSLSKQLVDLHKGRIEVCSAPGTETRFTIWLPKGSQHLHPAEITSHSESRLIPPPSSLAMDPSWVESGSLADESSVGAAISKNGEKARILLVEDHEDIRVFLESILTPEYQVYHAVNGLEGVEKARAYLPDIIISDVSMPDMDGYEFCRQTKTHPLTSHIFIIMLSVRASESHRLHGYAQGADDYLAKPFNPSLLKLKIQNLLISRKQFREQVLNQPGAFLSKSASDLPPIEDEFLKQMMGIIEDNISNPEFKVEHLCSELGASKSQLYRKLKSLTGHSPLELIRMIRLQRATQLLQNKRLRIMEITYKVGFNDLQHFRKMFRNQYGMTPQEYRRTMAENPSPTSVS